MIIKHKKSIILFSALLLLFLILGINSPEKSGKNKNLPAANSQTSEAIKIAACPTCTKMANNLPIEKYQLIPTVSTAQSIELLLNGQVDLMLAGRTLRPEEPKLDALIIRAGYSFLSSKEMTIYASELRNYNIYTDLDANLLKTHFPIEEIQQVDDICAYLDKGITITSWENTNYANAEIVHILEDNGDRTKLSRQPTIYCPEACGKEVQEIASLLK